LERGTIVSPTKGEMAGGTVTKTREASVDKGRGALRGGWLTIYKGSLFLGGHAEKRTFKKNLSGTEVKQAASRNHNGTTTKMAPEKLLSKKEGPLSQILLRGRKRIPIVL